MTICFPSRPPMQLGNCHLSSNLAEIFNHCSSEEGTLGKTGYRFLIIALQTSFTT